jgi:RNA polymerase sigma-70 factor, ECF subfamily
VTVPQVPAPQLADLEVLYDAHHRQAIGLAYRMLGDLGDAEEVVQEVFLAAWRSGHTYNAARGSSQTWLLSMVRNRAIDTLRARRRRPVQQLPEGIDPPDTSDVPAQALSNVDGETARVALDSLPPEQKQAIELAYFGGLSHTEIATQLAAPIGTIKGRIRLGLDRLRVAMGVPQDVLSTS